MRDTFFLAGLLLFGFITSVFGWALIGYPLWHDYIVPVYQVLGSA